MKARDASKITPLIAPKMALTDTGISWPVKPAKLITKPPRKTAKKPPTVSGYNWKSDSSGYALRKVIYITDPDTGIKKRKLPRIGHLSQSAFAEMKKRHRGAALEKAIAEWIKEHDR